MKRDFESVLDDCLRSLHSGGDVAACVARYPEYGDELRPLLQVAADLSSIAPPPPVEAARQAARRRMLASVRKRHPQAVSETLLSRFAGMLFKRKEHGNVRLVRQLATLAVVILIMVTSGVTVAASRSSLPGDALYPVKLTAQRARMVFTLDKSERDVLSKKISDGRRQDIQSALLDDRQAKVEFRGVLQQVGDGVWIIGGLPVTLDHETVVKSAPVIGTELTVRGRLPGDGTLLATHLTVNEGDGALLSPLPTPSATPEPAETEDLEDDEDEMTPEPAETEELNDDDSDETPEPAETEEPNDDEEGGTIEPAESEEPDDDEDGGTIEPVESEEPDDDTCLLYTSPSPRDRS